MALDRNEFRQFITGFQFRELFNEMGWDRDSTAHAISVDDHRYELVSAGQKSGFKVLVCSPDADGHIPVASTRKKIETQVRRLFQEHLIIFHDAATTKQLWQWLSKQKDRPSRITETRWNSTQDPELLFQKASGIYFELAEEDDITIVDVTSRVEANFDQNNERVTKRFYDAFKKQHDDFASFVTGIHDHLADKDNQAKQWYVSLMLNRLMFCYFIQKKGFLDKDKNYLKKKLAECRDKHGANQYYSFYRNFLLALFHDGLGKPEHDAELQAEIGTIPYLNGGLFDTHELERTFEAIEIEDEAFESIFAFFDQYEWHLDTRHTATGRDVNPDVIGYIFEKYINERAAMGAYYTKEDITDYISKNCILPFLFDETARHYPKAFKKDGEIWSMLRASGDTYIYDAVKHGVDVPYPPEIEIGLDTTQPDLLERRKDWNKKAPAEAALPTEIWREVVDRRRRYSEGRAKIESGEIVAINDFITYNLNIRQFVLDCVQNTQDAKFLQHFYKSIAGHIPGQGTNESERHPISILDPTCGSGAFLFAALNILEELYSACLQRMEDFIDDEDRANAEDRSNFKNQYAYFRRVLADVKDEAKHPSRQYFVYKSIILNNLYGVDIMKEAVEIAKLRLFLKLVATVDANYSKDNLGLEPLPDIDFNIRAGNTLVGFANEADLDGALRTTVEGAIAKPGITEKMEMVAMAWAHFKNCQVTIRDYRTIKGVKDTLYERLADLNHELNQLFHKDTAPSQEYDEWLQTHRPFHWLAEFYEIVCGRGGFDCIIGNPPYVEFTKVSYSLKNYKTISCGNLYAYVTERSDYILSTSGRIGMIVQLPIVCTDRMIPLQSFMLNQFSRNYFSTYDDRPGKLFDGLEHIRATIFVSSKAVKSHEMFTTRYVRWNSEYRPHLFETITYHPNEFSVSGSILKVGSALQKGLFEKLLMHKPLSFSLAGSETVYFHNAPQYWIRATDFVPYFWNERDGQKPSVQIKAINVATKDHLSTVNCAINSSLFYIWFIAWSDCRHLNMREIEQFPMSLEGIPSSITSALRPLNRSLMDDYQANKRRKSTTYKTTGKVEYDEYFPRHSKAIIDEIDTAFGKHYGFTDEELDFIINYDIKYRMGAELDGGDDSTE